MPWYRTYAEHRDNSYLQPGALNSALAASSGVFPNFDCKNPDYQPNTQRGDPETQDEEIFGVDDSTPAGVPPVSPAFAPCVIAGGWQNVDPSFGSGRFPQLFADP